MQFHLVRVKNGLTALPVWVKRCGCYPYDNEFHTIENERNQLDYSARLSQFFGYYLKNYPAPNWMTIGVLIFG